YNKRLCLIVNRRTPFHFTLLLRHFFLLLPSFLPSIFAQMGVIVKYFLAQYFQPVQNRLYKALFIVLPFFLAQWRYRPKIAFWRNHFSRTKTGFTSLFPPSHPLFCHNPSRVTHWGCRSAPVVPSQLSENRLKQAQSIKVRG